LATEWLTTTITGRAQVPLVTAGDGPALIFNADPNNTIYMGDDYGLQPGGSNVVPVSPLGTIAVDGNHNVFGVCLPGQTAIVYVVPGGVNFFQLVNILAKSLIVNTGGPTVTGVFVYNGTGAPGNGPILSIVAPGTTSDPYGNPVQAVLTIGDQSGGFASTTPIQIVQDQATGVSSRTTTVASTGSGHCIVVVAGTQINETVITNVSVGGTSGGALAVGGSGSSIWVFPNAPSGQTTVTTTLSGSDDPQLTIYEIPGVLLIDPVDQVSPQPVQSTVLPWASGATPTTLQTTEIAIGVMSGFDALFSGPGPTVATSSPWISQPQQTVATWNVTLTGYQILNSEQAVNYTGTTNLSSPNLNYTACVVTLKAQGQTGQGVRFDDNGIMYLTNSTGQTSTLYQSPGSALGITNPNGLQGFIAIAFDPEVAQHNFTTTVFTTITKHYAVPANDMSVGTTYRITAHGNMTAGTTADDAPLWQGEFGGQAGASCETSALIGTGAAYGWKVVLEVTCYSTGSSGSIAMSLLATVAAANAEGLIAYGWSITLPCNTTMENDFFLQAKWSATTGVPVGASRDNMLERIGP